MADAYKEEIDPDTDEEWDPLAGGDQHSTLPNPPRGRELLVDLDLNPRLVSLQSRYTSFRPWQVDAVSEIVSAAMDGERVMVLDAPVGSGKTLIAEASRLILGSKGAFVCSGKDLQHQFANDFSAPILMGMSNYIPTPAPYDTDITCADCDYDPGKMFDNCSYCDERSSCPYVIAKEEAQGSRVASLNAHFWLSATHNPRSTWSHRGLTVFDECTTLEDVLMSQAEIYISDRLASKLYLPPPERMTVAESHVEWVNETAIPHVKDRLERLKKSSDVRDRRESKRLKELSRTLIMMAEDIAEGFPWVYTGGAGSARRRGEVISFKPVSVSRYGETAIWPKSPRFLLMDGTVVSSQMLLQELGWPRHAGHSSHTLISIPSPFPVANRQVIFTPIVDMSRRAQDEDENTVVKLSSAIATILDNNSGRALIHTVSYSLAAKISALLRDSQDRPVFTYASSADRARALDDYKRTENAVLVASSMERGIDLPDDLCRIQVIAKVPFPNLGDKQVGARMHAPGGPIWYQVKVARAIQQMCGRGVRHQNDWCKTFILDAQWEKHYRGWRHLYPAWWQQAYRRDYI